MDDPSSEQRKREIEESERHVNSKRYREGLDHLEMLVNSPMAKSELGKVYYLAAVCLQGLNSNYKRALDYYNSALENGYQEFWVLYNRGLLNIELGDLESARIDLDRAVSLNPSNQGARKFRDLIVNSHPDGDQPELKLASPVVACCVGKSGTILLRNILTSILGENLVIPSNFFKRGLVTSEYIKALPKLTNRVYLGHIWYDDDVAKKLSSIPKIVLIRDPRDNVVSYAHFMDSIAKDVFGSGEEYWSKKDWDEKLSTMIFGFRKPRIGLSSVNNTYLNYGIKWLGHNTFLVRYEDLIGTRFGGNDVTVIKTMKSIMDFIRLEIDEDTLTRKVAEGSDPNKSQTFRSGGEGKWRHEFKPYHVSQMKTAAPNLVSALGYEPDEKWEIHRKTRKKDLSEISIDADCLIKMDASDARTRYLQMRKETEGKKGLERLIAEWALNEFIEKRQYQDVVLILEQLLKEEATNPFWNYLYALYLHVLRNQYTEKALHHYESALENGYDEFAVRYNRASLFAQLGRKQAAVADLECALKLKPMDKATRDMLLALQTGT
jgi:tetratricopeptide (TPR) repeat protein